MIFNINIPMKVPSLDRLRKELLVPKGNLPKAVVLGVRGNVVKLLFGEDILFLLVKKRELSLKEGEIVNLLFENRDLVTRVAPELENQRRIEATVLFVMKRSGEGSKEESGTPKMVGNNTSHEREFPVSVKLRERVENLMMDLVRTLDELIARRSNEVQGKESWDGSVSKPAKKEGMMRELLKDLIDILNDVEKSCIDENVKNGDELNRKILRLFRGFKEMILRLRDNLDVWLKLPKNLRKEVILLYSGLNPKTEASANLEIVGRSERYRNIRSSRVLMDTILVEMKRMEGKSFPESLRADRNLRIRIKRLVKLLKTLFLKTNFRNLRSPKLIEKGIDPAMLINSKIEGECRMEKIELMNRMDESLDELERDLHGIMDEESVRKLRNTIEKILFEFQKKLIMKLPKFIWKDTSDVLFKKVARIILNRLEGPPDRLKVAKDRILRFFSNLKSEIENIAHGDTTESSKPWSKMERLGKVVRNPPNSGDEILKDTVKIDDDPDSLSRFTTRLINDLGVPWFESLFFKVNGKISRMDVMRDPRRFSSNFRVFFDLNTNNFGEIFIDMTLSKRTLSISMYVERNREIIQRYVDDLIDFVKDEGYGVGRIFVGDLSDPSMAYHERERLLDLGRENRGGLEWIA